MTLNCVLYGFGVLVVFHFGLWDNCDIFRYFTDQTVNQLISQSIISYKQ